MKLSFSTGAWPFSMDEAMQMALEMHYDGLEISAASLHKYLQMGGSLSPARLSDTARNLNEASLSVSALAAEEDWNKEMIRSLVALAHDLRCSFVVLPILDDVDEAARRIEKVLPDAEKAGVTLLVPSCGRYADTGKLKMLLDSFASDSLGAVWDIPCAASAGKSPEEIVTDLGAYIRHVHLCDGIKNNGIMEKKLLGEGEMNLSEVFAALRSISFDGFYSFDWQPGEGSLGDADVVFSH